MCLAALTSSCRMPKPTHVRVVASCQVVARNLGKSLVDMSSRSRTESLVGLTNERSRSSTWSRRFVVDPQLPSAHPCPCQIFFSYRVVLKASCAVVVPPSSTFKCLALSPCFLAI